MMSCVEMGGDVGGLLVAELEGGVCLVTE